MSWNKKIAGSKEGIKAAVDADTSVPQAVKDVVATALHDYVEPDETVTVLETAGHLGSGWCSFKLDLHSIAKVAAVLLAVVALFVSTPALADQKANRLRATYGQIAAEPGDFFGDEAADVYGLNFEHVIAKSPVGFQVDAYKAKDSDDSLTGTADLSFHASSFVFQVGADYFDATDDWGANAGVGLDRCWKSFCWQVVARYHRLFEKAEESSLGYDFADAYHLTLQGAVGVGW